VGPIYRYPSVLVAYRLHVYSGFACSTVQIGSTY
jgi:hypothetical protein